MHLKCPHCKNPIEFVGIDLQPVVCPSCGSSVRVIETDTITLPRPELKKIGRFELRELLGSGHYGDVWKAYDDTLDRIVAVKIPRRDQLDPREVEQFLREARAAAQLKDPHIVPVHEVGIDNERVFIVSDFIPGVNLAEWLSAGRATPAQAAGWCATLADALHHAHEAGVIHRDLKPSNVLLDTNLEPHLTDFGLAKREAAEITVTAEGLILGTPAYMSPEQARGDSHQADRRSDLYSLGVILYELLAGQRPFRGQSRMLIQQVLAEEPVPPRKFNRQAPRDLQTICLKAMEKKPERRYQTAAEMAADLRRYLAGQPILARPVSRVERSWRWARRNPLSASSLGFAACVLTASIALAVTDFSRVPPGEEPRAVTITTDPPGASVAFIPLRKSDGEVQPERIINARGKSPVALNLPPGDYLVVAYLDEVRFHEVYRRVAGPEERQSGPFRHNNWKMNPAGQVELYTIKIPAAQVTQGMTYFSGSTRFQMGANGVGVPVASSGVGIAPPHDRRVAPFYLDSTEVTVAQFQKKGMPLPRHLPPGTPDSYPISRVSFDEVIHYAEVLGKRVPEEVEYEFAATSGGTTRYPWGDAELIEAWGFGPAGEPAFDRTRTTPPVFGLYSNVAEWTSSRFNHYPARHMLPALDSVGARRIVRGGPFSIANGKPDPTDWNNGPRWRYGQTRQSWLPGLGFRCVRSAKPRLTPKDFSSVATNR